MLLRRPQSPSWKHPNPTIPDPSASPLSPKRWLIRDSGAVGLGIAATLDKNIVCNSLEKTNITTAPVAITSPFFCGSPSTSCHEEIIVPEYLSDCSMCKKRLHGKDIYMYMEKAFCSIECRYKRILSDEEQKKCKKMSKISCSPCSGGGRLFFTGVAAA